MKVFAPSLSGISVGLFRTSMFDHSLGSVVNQSVSFHHKEHLANPEGVAPPVNKLAGFSLVETCHCDGSTGICISAIWLATIGGSLCHAIKSTMSHLYCQKVMLCIGRSRTVSKDCVKCRLGKQHHLCMSGSVAFFFFAASTKILSQLNCWGTSKISY